MNKAEYKPAQGKMLAMIVRGGKIICIFKIAPTDEQGQAMAAGLNGLAFRSNSYAQA